MNRKVERCPDIIGIFPNADAIVRVVGTPILDTNGESTLAQCHRQPDPFARITDGPNDRLPVAAD